MGWRHTHPSGSQIRFGVRPYAAIIERRSQRVGRLSGPHADSRGISVCVFKLRGISTTYMSSSQPREAGAEAPGLVPD